MNTNVFGKFVTKVFILLLIVGLASLVTPKVVQAAHGPDQDHPKIVAVTITPPTGTAAPSMYATVRQKALDAGWLTYEQRQGGWTTANREAARQAISDLVDLETGFSKPASHANPINARFYTVGDTISVKVTFDRPVIAHKDLAMLIGFDGAARAAVHNQQAGDGAVTHTGVPPNTWYISTAPPYELTFEYTVQAGDNCYGRLTIPYLNPFNNSNLSSLVTLLAPADAHIIDNTNLLHNP